MNGGQYRSGFDQERYHRRRCGGRRRRSPYSRPGAHCITIGAQDYSVRPQGHGVPCPYKGVLLRGQNKGTNRWQTPCTAHHPVEFPRKSILKPLTGVWGCVTLLPTTEGRGWTKALRHVSAPWVWARSPLGLGFFYALWAPVGKGGEDGEGEARSQEEVAFHGPGAGG